VTVTRESRPTKEYPKGQEVYLLTFDRQESDLEPPEESPAEADPAPRVKDSTNPESRSDGST
jgi:hypothetical protein